MNEEEARKLVALARWTLERMVRQETWESGGPGLEAREDRAVDGFFVTLRKGGELRGCIGTVEKQDSLDATLRRMSVLAASEDPRFSPVEKDELADIIIDLSLLTAPTLVDDVQNIEIGRDGLIIEQGSRRGLLLPEVPQEYGWDRKRYLEELCQKAFLPPGAWRDPESRLYRFASIKFGESQP